MSEEMREQRRILLIGATGLIGRSVIARTPDMPEVALQGLARREMAFPEGTRMELVLADAEDWGEVIEALAPDAVICALGTTRAKAGGNEAFREVDYDLTLAVGRAAKEADVRNFVCISSVGADTASRSFYLRTKAEVERDLKLLRFTRLDVLRPGLLRGYRQADMRPLEGLGRMLAPVTDLFLQGERAKYRSIKSEIVAAAALQCTAEKPAGQFVHEHQAINRLAHLFEGAHE